MKAHGLVNPAVSAAVARLGHGQTLVIADPGLPLPAGVEVIDLSLTLGIPSFSDVLAAVTEELVIEAAVIASEAGDLPRQWVSGCITAPVSELSHAEFKAQLPQASAIIRTGEPTPYANVILRAGVPF